MFKMSMISVAGIVLALCSTAAAVKVKGKDYNNWFAFYNSISEANEVEFMKGYDLLVLYPKYVTPTYTELRGVLGNGPTLLGYISIGEHDYGIEKGNGKGPVYYDKKTGTRTYMNKGIASWFMDQDQDGNPDRHWDWPAYYVDPLDLDWRAKKVAEAKSFIDLGYQGIFIDTPEVAAPWGEKGWTAEGVYRVVEDLRKAFPDTILLFNRGLFFFVPIYVEQYKYRPTNLIDFLLVESYMFDSSYEKKQYNKSPFYESNRRFYMPEIIADIKRTGHEVGLLNIDYNNDPKNSNNLPEYSAWITDVVQEHGMIPLFQTKCVCATTRFFLENALPKDTSPPKWQSTASGLSVPINPNGFPLWQLGDSGGVSLSNKEPPARVGIQEVVDATPIKNSSATTRTVKVRWDVAFDQTGVKYNVYVANYKDTDAAKKMNWDSAKILPLSTDRLNGFFNSNSTEMNTWKFQDVTPSMPWNYVHPYRNFTYDEKVYAFEFDITGLSTCFMYTFGVRAIDYLGQAETNTVMISFVPAGFNPTAPSCTAPPTVAAVASSARKIPNTISTSDKASKDKVADKPANGVTGVNVYANTICALMSVLIVALF